MITYTTKQFNAGSHLDLEVNKQLVELRRIHRVVHWGTEVRVDATFRIDVQKVGGTDAEVLVQFSIERI